MADGQLWKLDAKDGAPSSPGPSIPCEAAPAIEDPGSLDGSLRPCDRALLWQLCIQRRPQWITQLRGWGATSTEDAEDILGDVTARIGELIDVQLAAIRNPEAWITRLLLNRCIDLSRRRRRHMALLASLPRRDLMDDSDPEAMIGCEELRQLAEAALLELPSAQRQVFLVRTTSGPSYLQIAAAQACSVAAARKRYQYARDRITHALALGGL